MTLQTLIEKIPNYSSRNDVARLIDICVEMENICPALFREMAELEDTLVAEAMQVVHDKACEKQRENCAIGFYGTAKESIEQAQQPKLEELL